MEITVGGKEVLLTTHKTYRESAETEGLKALMDFAPFKQFLAFSEERGPIPQSIIVRALKHLAHRLVSAMVDVEYVDSIGQRLTQSVYFTTYRPALLLPVVECGDDKYGIFVRQSRLALSFEQSDEALDGAISEDGGFVSDYDEFLQELGVQQSAIVPIDGRAYTVGNEGGFPYKVFTTSGLSFSTADELHVRLQQLSEGLSVKFVAAPMEVILSIGDAKARLAASLLLS